MKIIPGILLLLILLGCDSSRVTTISLYTEQPEILSLIDAYNRSSNSIKISLITGDRPEEVDLIIFKGLPSESPIPLRSLDRYQEYIDTTQFYEDLYDKDINLLPLSFDISGVIYNRETFNHSYSMNIEDFMELEVKFSPFWNEDFLTWYYLANLPDFSRNSNYFDRTIFSKSSINILNILYNRDDKWDVDTFNSKYLHLSPEKLLKMGIIDYYFYSLSDYIKLNDRDRELIGFTFLSSNNLLHIDDCMTYVGLSRTTTKEKSAISVLQWLFNSENQNYFINTNKKESGLYPLFIGELSTLKSVTTQGIPSIYPGLKNLLPLTSEITQHIGLPEQWTSLKKEVFGKILKELRDINEVEWEEKYDEYYIDWAKTHNK